MKDTILLIKYYLYGRPKYTMIGITIIALIFLIPSVTKEQKKEPSILELQAQIKTQIDNANSGITLQQTIADKEIQKAQAIIDTMTECKQANQVLKDSNSSLTIESFSSGATINNAINCKVYKLKQNQGSGTVSTSTPLPATRKLNRPLYPKELFLTTNVADKCAVSQTPSQHFIKNKRFAYDVACTFDSGKAQQFMAYAPDYLNKSTSYIVTKKYVDKYTGNTLELSFSGKNNSQNKWVIGHLTSNLSVGDTVITGQVIGQSDMSGLTTGYHNHIEIWMNGINYDYTTRSQVLENERYNNLQTWKWGDQVYFTHYTLGDTSQNDNDPCTGASGLDQCKLLKQGIKSIALTVDVRQSLDLKFGDTIEIAGPCGGQYKVLDEKNKRFRLSCIMEQGACNKGDIATQIGYKDSNGKLVITFDGVPNCRGGVHTLVKKIII